MPAEAGLPADRHHRRVAIGGGHDGPGDGLGRVAPAEDRLDPAPGADVAPGAEAAGGGHDGSVDDAGADGGHPDAGGRPVGPQAAGEGQHGRLGGDVGGLGGPHGVGQAGGDVHDLAGTAGQHPRPEGGAGVDDAVEVDRSDPAPVVDGHVGEAAGHADAGVVDEDIDRPGPLGQVGHGGGLGHVAAFGPAGAAPLGAEGGGLPGRLGVDVGADHGGAGGEGGGGGPADPAAGAGHDHQLVDHGSTRYSTIDRWSIRLVPWSTCPPL